jgi:hypothetical protein
MAALGVQTWHELINVLGSSSQPTLLLKFLLLLLLLVLLLLRICCCWPLLGQHWSHLPVLGCTAVNTAAFTHTQHTLLVPAHAQVQHTTSLGRRHCACWLTVCCTCCSTLQQKPWLHCWVLAAAVYGALLALFSSATATQRSYIVPRGSYTLILLLRTPGCHSRLS